MIEFWMSLISVSCWICNVGANDVRKLSVLDPLDEVDDQEEEVTGGPYEED